MTTDPHQHAARAASKPSIAQGPYWIPGRPLVVLAGWLGCQQRSLRRYEELYSRLGFCTLIRIAPPSLVLPLAKESVDTDISGRQPWKRSNQKNFVSMQDLAWDTLREIEASQCSVFVFHSFSNGGCFLWEQVRNILKSAEENGSNMGSDVPERLVQLRCKLVGLVFDSSPAVYPNVTPKDVKTEERAMQYCTWWERTQYYAQRFLGQTWTKNDFQQREQRALNYWIGMRNDPSNIPQLYLYSQDDDLAPYEALDELVTHRQGVFGRKTVFARKWASSPHCCHLLKHPNDYQLAVETFLDHCLCRDDTKIQSRL